LLAYDYPLLGILWTSLIISVWILWFILLFRIIGDIFHSTDLGGGAKALWLLFIIFVPFLGTFVYVIARGSSMTQRMLERAQAQQEALNASIRDAASSSGSTADELSKFAALRDQGVISDAEFEARKAQLLS
jgi:hypothetical protein